VLEERGRPRAGRELRGELAVAEVQRALAHQAARRGVPERRGAAVAEHDLVAVGDVEEIAQPTSHPSHELPDGLLAVRGTHQRSSRRGEMLELLGTDP